MSGFWLPRPSLRRASGTLREPVGVGVTLLACRARAAGDRRPGALKIGDLAGPLGDGIRPQVLAGSLLSGIAAYLSVRYLTRHFETRSLRPFGIYCILAGLACLVWFAIR